MTLPSAFKSPGRAMHEAKVLYRSVSPPELADIARTGRITGGGNLFNPADTRPDVFFADRIDPLLIGHGEHVPRRVTYALSKSRTSRKVDLITDRIERRASLILERLRGDGILYDPELATWFRYGQSTGQFRRMTFRAKRKRWRGYALHFRALRRLVRCQLSIERQYAELADREHRAIMLERSRADFASAILVTHPVTGGRLYEAASGLCGHGEREYGFDPGQLGIADLAEIIWVKDHAAIGIGDARLLASNPDFVFRFELHSSVEVEPSPCAHDGESNEQLPPEEELSENDNSKND